MLSFPQPRLFAPNYYRWTTTTMTTHVTETAAAISELAIKRFGEMLAFETDCWDVHETMKSVHRDFIVIFRLSGRRRRRAQFYFARSVLRLGIWRFTLRTRVALAFRRHWCVRRRTPVWGVDNGVRPRCAEWQGSKQPALCGLGLASISCLVGYRRAPQAEAAAALAVQRYGTAILA
jgi:hypothetical protein